jgi:hypothetical protein
MQEHIRALIVIIFLATVGFNIAKKSLPQDILSTNFNKWRNA